MKKLPGRTMTKWSVLDLFRNEQKQMELKCPSKGGRKLKQKEQKFVAKEPIGKDTAAPNVILEPKVNEMHFDIIKLGERRLDIPAFKQFKNNMTDFTADGEEQFKEIITKIRDFLGSNTDGKGVTLRIVGSASQIPTSFDYTKPNNNIRADGGSIPGQTSIANNKLLARARALELANKIQLVFKNITIVMPTVEEIKLGATAWDWNAQRRLNKAVKAKDKAAIAAVYEPYQKEQFVKVESEEVHTKTVKPESIKMYTVRVTPQVYYSDGTAQAIIDEFIVSKSTYI